MFLSRRKTEGRVKRELIPVRWRPIPDQLDAEPDPQKKAAGRAVGAPPTRVMYEAAKITEIIQAYQTYRKEGRRPTFANVRFAEDGLHIEDVAIVGVLTLANLRLPMRLCFWKCEFLHGVDVRWMEVDELSFEKCTFRSAFRGQSLKVAGHLDFSGVDAYHSIDISVAKVGGDVKLRGARLRYNPNDDDASRHSREDSPRWGAPLFAGGIAAHSMLMEQMECHGRVFMDAAKLSGILMATDAKLHSIYAVEGAKGDPISLWDHLALSATDASIEGAVILGKEARGSELDPKKAHFSAFGQVSFANSVLRGDLICSGARVYSAFVACHPTVVARIADLDDMRLAALHVSRALIEGSVFIDSNFLARGEVRFNGADVQGTFGCNNAIFDGRIPDAQQAELPVVAKALSLRRANVGSDLNLNHGVRSYGTMDLRNIAIGGELDCIGGEFRGWRSQKTVDGASQPESLALSGSEIQGHALFCVKISSAESPPRFRSFGEVRFRGAKVHGNFHLDGGLFDICEQDLNASPRHSHLDRLRRWLRKEPIDDAPTVARFESLAVAGTTFLANSETREFNARTSRRVAIPDAATFKGSVSFEGMSSTVWEDSEDCWPQHEARFHRRAFIELNGLTYQRLRGPLSGTKRLVWLLHQPDRDLVRREPKLSLDKPEVASNDDRRDWGFKTQPWEQCASVLYSMGYRRDARYLNRMQQRFVRLHGRLNGFEKFYNGLIAILVGHGYRPYYSFFWAIAMLVIGWMVFEFGYRHGQIVSAKGQTESVSELAAFNGLLYSADAILPVVELHERERWQISDAELTADASNERSGLTLGSLLRVVWDETFQWWQTSDWIWRVAAVIIGILVLFFTRPWSLFRWIRDESWPNFRGSSGRQYRREWRSVFVRATRLEKRWLGRLFAPIGGPTLTSYALAFGFVVIVIAWPYDFLLTDKMLSSFDWGLRTFLQVTLVRAWFVWETVWGWLLVSALIVGIGGTVFRSER